MGLRFFFLPIFPGATFIQGGTFIPDSRVHTKSIFVINKICTFYVPQALYYIEWIHIPTKSIFVPSLLFPDICQHHKCTYSHIALLWQSSFLYSTPFWVFRFDNFRQNQDRKVYADLISFYLGSTFVFTMREWI